MFTLFTSTTEIIRIRDVRFHEGDILKRDNEGEALPKAVFDEEAEEFTLEKICLKTTFGSGKPPAPRIPETSQSRFDNS